MTDFYWDLCPRCGASGRIAVQTCLLTGTALSDRTAPLVEERDCEACDGLGRIKVPTGYRLCADPVPAVVTTNGTMRTATRDGSGVITYRR